MSPVVLRSGTKRRRQWLIVRFATKRRRSSRIPNGQQLPEDVIMLILSWLPVISLLKFKSVSKSWLSLISSQEFSKLHLLNSRRCDSKVIMCTGGKSIVHCPLSQLLCVTRPNYDPLIKNPQLDYNSDSLFSKVGNVLEKYHHRAARSYFIVGSYHGLICVLVDEKDLILCNPSTRKCRLLPNHGVKSSKYRTFGLGFDKSNYDYKLLAFFTVEDSGNNVCAFAKVYSLETDRWETIHMDPAAVSYVHGPIIFGNGKFYWVQHQYVTQSKVYQAVLLYLDLENMPRCGKINVPEYTPLEVNRFSLSISECGSLHVLCAHETNVTVWMLDENNSIWTRLCAINYHDVDSADLSRVQFNDCTFFVLSDGEIMILISRLTFMIVDPKDRSIRYSGLRLPGHLGVRACGYVESLVAL